MFHRSLPVCLGVWLVTVLAAHAQAAFSAHRLFPAPGATEVTPDAPLRLVFAAAPSLVPTGRIQIHDAASRAVVETFTLGSPVSERTIGGIDHFQVYSVLGVDREVRLVPKTGTLAYGRSYYVTVSAGAFVTGDDSFSGIDGPTAWSFTTRAAPPAPGAKRVIVAADGSGDFCTVQAALDYIPDGNTDPVTVFLRKGTYREIIFFTGKHAVTILGEDRRETVIAYPNNAKFNSYRGNPSGGATPNPAGEPARAGGGVNRRGMFLAHRVDDFTLANLTLWNTTPQGGSQAEALIVNGSASARAVIKDVNFRSFQDTIQLNGQVYVTGCFIEGDVDFMWGTGPAFFEHCTARSLRSSAYYTQVRNPAGQHGFVFVRCTFEGAPGVTENFLSRIEPHRFPHSEVVLIDCTLGASVAAVGWQLQAPRDGALPGSTSSLRFMEFNSRAPDGKPADVSQRLSVSRQLRLPADAELVANYSDPTFVLGRDWQPRRARIMER
jgi:pectin methylesterase-like acyl-CoA thioesterase